MGSGLKPFLQERRSLYSCWRRRVAFESREQRRSRRSSRRRAKRSSAGRAFRLVRTCAPGGVGTTASAALSRRPGPQGDGQAVLVKTVVEEGAGAGGELRAAKRARLRSRAACAPSHDGRAHPIFQNFVKAMIRGCGLPAEGPTERGGGFLKQVAYDCANSGKFESRHRMSPEKKWLDSSLEKFNGGSADRSLVMQASVDQA